MAKKKLLLTKEAADILRISEKYLRSLTMMVEADLKRTRGE